MGDRFDFKDNMVFRFFVTCSNENEWRKRHMVRIENPLPHQIFESFEHVLEHYKNADVNPFENEYVIDTADTVENSFESILKHIMW